jgi:hypothetical protein
MELINLTPFAADRVIVMDGTGCEMLVVLVKATFALDGGAPVLAEQQDAIVMADEYLSEPGTSSLRRAAETSLFKPSADVVVTGSAHTQRNRRTEALVVLDIASRVRKAVQVHGDRVWEGRIGGGISPPQAFLSLPLVYERAFGGVDTSTQPAESWPANPVGVGFRAKASKAPRAGAPLPNLEDLRNPISRSTDRPSSLCFGPIAPGWASRRVYAGTYDAAWQRDRLPFPPADFDPRFSHPVPADQVLPGYLMGGEQVAITCVRPEGGGYRFALPSFHPEVVVRLGGKRQVPQVFCDTLAIDCEAQRLSLVCRALVKVHGRVAELEWIKIQERASA